MATVMRCSMLDIDYGDTPTIMEENDDVQKPQKEPEVRKPSRSGVMMDVKLPKRHGRPSVVAATALGRHQKEYSPGEIVQELLDRVKDPGHRTHHIFAELDVLRKYNDIWEWRERSRWVKYEEDVEEGGDRWSKPHVASLNMHSLFNLRKQLLEGAMLLDEDYFTLSEIVDGCLDTWVEKGSLSTGLRAYVRDAAMLSHKHKHVSRKEHKKGVRTLADIRADGGSSGNLRQSASSSSFDSFGRSPSATDLQSMGADSGGLYKPNLHFMKKIHKDAQVAHLMVGAIEHLTHALFAFVRLKEPRDLGDISEVSYPSRFVFFGLVPNKDETSESELIETGRCLGTLLVDEVFREVAYKGKQRSHLIAGVDEFMEQVTVLPPGEWDPKIRIEPPPTVPSQEFRRMSVANSLANMGQLLNQITKPSAAEESHVDPSLVVSKTPFKGLYEDIKRKIPHYGSDFKDALHIQCLAAFIYVFLGTLTPNVTFGALLGTATDNYMGVMECIFAAAVTGVIFALFSGQPLNILGSTGPMLVLEKIIYDLCKDNGWDYLPARVWVGLWTTVLILLIAVFNLSALVKYITRFTEESFACLIALIFIIEAFKEVAKIPEHLVCDCHSTGCNDSFPNFTETVTNCTNPFNIIFNSGPDECIAKHGVIVGDDCDHGILYLSFIEFVGTFFIAYVLVDFKTYSFFPAAIRRLISDFAVLIAIILMVITDIVLGVKTPKLTVPEKFVPTKSDVRGWLINPISDNNPDWLIFAAILPAILCVILIFLDQQITAVIVNRKENKLVKGVGYHLDMLVLAVCVGINSFLGLPWYVAATVSALAHINSLKRESECNAPGEKPTFLGVREQRVTALAIGILSGLCIFITSILSYIPNPVLYGVFLFMGVSALRGMQACTTLIDRLYLFFQPVKYQPDLVYLRHVPLHRVHIFTLVQVICLAALWAVKSIKSISIVFPVMVLATGVVRKLLEFTFPLEDLKWLDELLPGTSIEKKPRKNFSDNELQMHYNSLMEHKENSHSRVSFSFQGDEPEQTLIGNGKTNPSFFLSDETDIPNGKVVKDQGDDTKL
ncbi:hypothetical protein ScPMuIL_016067 [Solemya velum]